MRLYRVTTQYVERPNGFYVYTKNTAPPVLLCSMFEPESRIHPWVLHARVTPTFTVP